MTAVVEAVVNIVEDVVEAVGDVVEDVVEVVENVVETVVENPEIIVIAVVAPQVLPAIGVPAVAVQPITSALITASQGGDLEAIGESALVSFVAPKVGGAVATTASQSGLQDTLANAVGSAAGSATAAAITGGDIGESAIAGGLGSVVSSTVENVGAEQGLPPAIAETVGDIAGSTAAGAVSGNAGAGLTSGITSELLSALNTELNNLASEDVDIGFGPGRFTPEVTAEDVVGMSDEDFDTLMSAIEQDLTDQERTDLGTFAPDYSLTAGSTRPEAEGMGGGQGITGELADLPEGEPVDFENIFEGEFGGEGVRVPEVPGLESMGGGTGLTVPREGETVTEEGVIPEDQILEQIKEELYPTPDLEGEAPTPEAAPKGPELQVRVVGEPSTASMGVPRQRGETPGISPRVTGEAGAGILGEKEPLFGGDEDKQRAVWNRRSLRLRRALGL